MPAAFFMHRHVYGKWTCRCCRSLKQEPAVPEIIEGGLAASGVHTPRSTLTAWSGQAAVDQTQAVARAGRAMGRKAWTLVGSELAGQRAAMVMSLVQSAQLNGHDPFAYLSKVLRRLPTQLNSGLDELLPHRWQQKAD